MQPIFEEIRFRFGEAEKEANLLALALTYFRRRAPAESAPEWKYLAIGGIASGMEKVYSGVEKTFQIIVRPHSRNDGCWRSPTELRMSCARCAPI